MKLRFEVSLASRYVTIDVGKRAAELYGRFSESGEDEDFDALIEEVIEDLAEAAVIEVSGVEIGR